MAKYSFKVRCVDRNTGEPIPYARVSFDTPVSTSSQASSAGYSAPIYVEQGTRVHGYASKSGYKRATIDVTTPNFDWTKEIRMTPGGMEIFIIVKGGGNFIKGAKVVGLGQIKYTDSAGMAKLKVPSESGTATVAIFPPAGSNFKPGGGKISYSRSRISFKYNLQGIQICSPGQKQIIEYCSDGKTPKEWKECSSDGQGWVTRVNYHCPEPEPPEVDVPSIPSYEPPTYEPPTYEPPTYEPPTYEPPSEPSTGEFPSYEPGKGLFDERGTGLYSPETFKGKTMEYIAVGIVLIIAFAIVMTLKERYR